MAKSKLKCVLDLLSLGGSKVLVGNVYEEENLVKKSNGGLFYMKEKLRSSYNFQLTADEVF